MHYTSVLTWGDGDSSSASRSHPSRSLPNDHRLNTNQTPAVPSLSGMVKVRGHTRSNTPTVALSSDSSAVRRSNPHRPSGCRRFVGREDYFVTSQGFTQAGERHFSARVERVEECLELRQIRVVGYVAGVE